MEDFGGYSPEIGNFPINPRYDTFSDKPPVFHKNEMGSISRTSGIIF